MPDEQNSNESGPAPRTPLEEYQAFIDGLLTWPRHSVRAKWVEEWSENAEGRSYVTPPEFNEQMRPFTPEQRSVIASLIKAEREGAIHDALAYLTAKINLEGLRLSRQGTPLAIEPYGSEMYYDWVCRCAGSDWPENPIE